jgi:8-oxo-dGTP diphosphatase
MLISATLADAFVDFMGAKLALLAGGRVLTYLRDDFAHIPWPAMWDLPGGRREGRETPEACVLRELEEEFGLALPADRLVWRRSMPGMLDARRVSWFFAGTLEPSEVAAIRFGDEGQLWQMMPVEDFLNHPRAVPALQDRTRLAFGDLGWL